MYMYSILFIICRSGRYVISGNDTGLVHIYDTLSAPVETDDSDAIINPHLMFKAHDDCVNGVR